MRDIFDKEGNKLDVPTVIYDFIKENADRSKKDIEDVYIGVDIGLHKNNHWLVFVEVVDNGYDAVNLHEFSEPIKVNI